MNGYRSYFDRVRLSEAQHRRLMEALDRTRRTRPAPKARRPSRWAAAVAACGVLALAAYPIRHAGGLPRPSAGAAQSPAPVETGAASTRAPQAGAEYVLEVGDPFAGQHHSDFSLPALEFTYCDFSKHLELDYAPPADYSVYRLTAEDIVRAVGGTEQAPWTLGWEGFALGGNAWIDGGGALLWAAITGKRDGSSAEIELWLASGGLPPTDVAYEEAEQTEYDGTAVTLYYTDVGSGDWRYYADFMCGDTGVRFQCTSRDQDEAARLAALAVRQIGYGGFTVEGLEPDEGALVYASRRTDLSLEDLRADPLGAWLPAKLPEGFAFKSGGRQTMRDVDTLFASWSRGYDYVELSVARFPTSASLPAADLKAGAVTAEALKAFGRYVEDDAGDVPGWRFQFTVDAGAASVRYTLKGLSPEEAAALVNGAAPPAGGDGP